MLTINSLLIFRRFSSSYKNKNRISSISSSLTKLDLSMKALMNSKQYEKALDLFDKQTEFHTDISFNLALKSCTKLYDYERGINIQKQLSSHSFQNPFIQTSLIHFYMQCRDIDNAMHLFSTTAKKSNEIYATMFQGFILNKMPEKVLNLFDEMKIKPNGIALTLIFKACAQLNDDRAKKIGKSLLDQMPNNYRQDTILITSAIYMLMKFGEVKNAEHLFETINNKDIFTYGALMKGYVDNNISEKALDLFEQMPFKPDDVIYIIIFNACAQLTNDRAMKIGKKFLEQMPNNFRRNDILLNSITHMLMKFGDVENAQQFFQKIKNKSVITYGTMINGYNINNESLKGLKLFDEMKQHNIVPNVIVFMLLLGACARIGILSICQSLINEIPLHFRDDQRICSSLINMWGKAGSVKDAQQIFASIHQPNVITYNSMINAFGLNRMGLEAVDLYKKITNNLRDEVSYICVLNACSHSGLVDEARSIFNEIPHKTEKVITTMIDCLSRLYLFDEAQKLIEDYEKLNPPSLPMYMAILSGARNSRQLILSEKIYNRMKSLFPDKKDSLVAASILLCNIYSSLGDHEQASDLRLNRIKEIGNKVKPGLSWTEVDGKVVEFTAHDQSHPESKEIHAEMKRLSVELIKYGHKYDSSWITRALDEDETIESILCGHSEKLAIAFNFVRRSKPSLIQVTKNLRICGDCHEAIKLIAKIRQCEIIVRDANCIHHFSRDGTCSCKDHF